jgi:hypothetical protein
LSIAYPLFLLRFFADDLLVGVAHTLALVGLRRPLGANLRRNLTDPLLVRAFDDDLGRRRGLDLDASGTG